MGLWRVIWTGCCGMCCLIPMAFISFNLLDLGAAITNGLFVDLGDALDTLFAAAIPESLGGLSAIVPILVEGSLGIIMLLFFPLHWSLYYRPDNIGFAFAIMLPWLLTGTITSALFCKSAKKGFDTGMAIGLGYLISAGVIPSILFAVLSGYAGFDITNIFDGLFRGMTDLPFLWAVVTSTLEGAVIGGIFGAFIGSLKYDPDEEEEEGKKGKKGKKSKKKTAEPAISSPGFGNSGFGSSSTASTFGSSSSSGSEFCPNCGAKVMANDPFCPNCGTKI